MRREGFLRWGCGESGRLGHGGCSEKAEYVLQKVALSAPNVRSPVLVAALRGKFVESVCMTVEGCFAFAPSMVCGCEPPLVPVSGGCQIVLRGGGFWKSAEIVAKFAPVAKDATTPPDAARSAAGTFVRPSADSGKDSQRPGIACSVPRFARPGWVVAEVSMNGKDFTASGVKVRLYQDPELSGIEPLCCERLGAQELRISGTHLRETGLVKVKFKERGGQGREWVVNATVRKRAKEEEEEESEDVFHDDDEESVTEQRRERVVVCASPTVDSQEDLPITARVSVAMNGKDFVSLTNATLVMHEVAVERLKPDCSPLRRTKKPLKRTKSPPVEGLLRASTPERSEEQRREVELHGKSFFDAPNQLVRLTVSHDGKLLSKDCKLTYKSKTLATFEPPTFSLTSVFFFVKKKIAPSREREREREKERAIP